MRCSGRDREGEELLTPSRRQPGICVSLDEPWTADERMASDRGGSSCRRVGEGTGVRIWMPTSRSFRKRNERDETSSVGALFLRTRRSTWRCCYRRLHRPIDDSLLASRRGFQCRAGAGESSQTRRRPMDARGIHHAARSRMPRSGITEKSQVRGGAPPVTRTPNPLIKRWRNYPLTVLRSATEYRSVPVLEFLHWRQ
jgi:hypothetical protein